MADVLGHREGKMSATPSSLGYRMPAEWEKHAGTWISWPKDPNTFPSGILPRVEAAYVEMVKALAEGEEVRILVDDEKGEARAKSQLRRVEQASYLRIKTVDVWVRDYGPICVRGKDVALVRWRFNAWGNKYDDLLPDDMSGDELALETGWRVFRPGIVLEGGSIDVDGKGRVMTTEQCLLNPNRNPGLGKAELERALKENLGVDEVVWLKSGIEGDDTDGHIDDIARFVGDRAVAAAVEDQARDPNHEPLAENLRLLEGHRGDFEVHRIPMPPRMETSDGRLPASHLNFYVGNDAVLVPTFGGSSDRQALKALEEAFPSRGIVGVDCRALVHGLGTLHCVTQQIPAL
jgi:agmatine deiminase